MKKYDIAIMGGGFGGTCAAIAAARNGARVLLIDKSNCLGGAAMNCLVNPFMDFSTRIDGENFPLTRGLIEEIMERLDKMGAMSGLHFQEEELKYLLNEMALEAGVELLFHAYLSGVEREGDRINALKLSTIGGEVRIEADYFIDATGDAQVTYLAGFETKLGRESDNLCQPMTLCFRLGNVDVERFNKSRPALQEAYKQAQATGEITNPRENILIFKMPVKNVLHFNTTRVVKKNPTDAWEVTEAEIIARRQVFEIYEFMKKHADGLENSFLMSTAAEIGVRESRMIVGEYVLTEQDCRDLKKFDDAIAACNYDIDIHNPEGTGTSHHYFGAGEYYTIPYRSLIPKGAENLLVAGRCISSDHGAQASYRVMTPVACIGQAAGIAASLAAKSKVRPQEIDVALLQKLLRENGAFLGI